MKVKILLTLSIIFFGISIFLWRNNVALRKELENRDKTIFHLLSANDNTFQRQFYNPAYNSTPINVHSDKPLSDSAIEAILQSAQDAMKKR